MTCSGVSTVVTRLPATEAEALPASSPPNTLPKTVKSPTPFILGLSAPACVLVARELLRRDATDPEHPLLVVVPTKDAIRLLREQLAVAAARGGANGALLCPRIISASQLTAGQSERVASPQLQQAALFCVLKREAARFPHLVPQAARWSEGDFLAKAEQFRQLYTTLCHEGIPANGGDAASRALAEQDPLWQELFSLYPLYCEELHRHGWCAPAEAPPLRLAEGTRVILACVPSLSERAKQLLENSGHPVELWLHTDEWHEGPGWFDAWGRPGENWLATPAEDVLGLETPGWQRNFLVCGDLERMAIETARAAGRCGGEAVAVAVCDPGMESAVAEAFAHHGVRTVRPRGIPFSASGWRRLLLTLTRQVELLEEMGQRAEETERLSADTTSDLLRNPVLTDGLALPNAAQAAKAADQLMRSSLPASFGMMSRLAPETLRSALLPLGHWLSSALSSAENLLQALCTLASNQLEAFPESLPEEAASIAADFSAQMEAACRQLLESGWANELSVLSTLNLLNSAGGFANAPHPPHALSLRGWLELSFAPEERLILAGLHDGIIPERWPASPLLTPQTVEALGLPRDDARAARDAYLLRSLYRCRPGKVQAIFTLLNARRDPLFPSSCFFRLTPQHHLAELVGHFFDRRRPCPSTTQLPYDGTGWDYHRLHLPAAEDDVATLAALTLRDICLPNPMAGKSFSPSSLRQFLACPLRFWLSRLNAMQDDSISPTQRDLEAKDLGTYLHDALEEFVKRYPRHADFLAAWPEAAESKDEERIITLIENELDDAFLKLYERKHGRPELLPRQFQCAAMRRRLRGYARLHLQLWQEGWEAARDTDGRLMLEHKVRWELFGHPLEFRIDRIDRRVNPQDGQLEYRVIDYKTGDVTTCYKNHLEELPLPGERADLHLLDARLEPAIGPATKTVAKQAHLRWKDLQLPLYTAWALERFGGCRVNSAYINLSAVPGQVRLIAWGDSDKDPDFFAPRFVPRNAKYKEDVNAEPLYENALRWIRFGLDAMAEGRCFVTAEMMGWTPPEQSYDIFGDILALAPLGKALLRFATTHRND